MIKHFSVLYVGNIDLENVGSDGTPADERRYPNARLIESYDSATRAAKLMDKLGYYALWMAEHHFQPEGYECIPNVLMLALHLTHLTKNIRIGCGFNIAPMWHPLRMAEDYATADYLTGGRVRFGVGRGYHSREIETFGSPLFDQEANRDLFEEQVDIIFKAFENESFSHKGKYYTIPPSVPYRGYQLEEITLVPRPVNPVECWQPIQSATPRGLDFMAKHGIKGVIGGGVAEGGAMHRVVEAYQQANARAGRQLELGENLSFGFQFYISDSVEQGIKEAGKYYEENLKMFGPLRLVRALSEEQIEQMSDPKVAPTADLPKIDDAVKAGGFLTGPPELIIDQLKTLEERYPGLERISVGQPVGTPQSVIVEQLERFSKEIMPAFKGKVQQPVTAD